METGESRRKHLIFGFFIGIAFSILPFYFLRIPSELSVTIALFNFLFTSLIFPLNGTLTKKIFLLVIGNFVGICWNYLFYLFAYTAASFIGNLFSIPYIILSPFINLVWVVFFWTISLTLLASPKEVEGEI